MNLLITELIQLNTDQIRIIKQMNHEVCFIQNERIPLEEQGINLKWVQGVICNGLFLYNNISKFSNLEFIQLTSAGYDRVPIKYIQEHNIKIFNASGVYSIPMAEFAINGVLQIYKQSRFFFENQKLHKWEKNRELRELNEKTVCIVGCGNVGQECAKRFEAFGCNVNGIDLNSFQNRYFQEIYSMDRLESILSISDIVILTLPLTEQTKNLFNKKLFSCFKKGAVLVNIARGAILQESELLNALNQNILSGAVLDVFENEPLRKESPLWNMNNVILTPHNSFVGEGNSKRIFDTIFRNLKGLIYENK